MQPVLTSIIFVVGSLSGTVDGANTAFTLTNYPVAGSVEVLIEGHIKARSKEMISLLEEL
jgi:hypothetical protein